MFQPAFVVSVGDQIEGYTEDPAELDRQWTGIDGILARLSVPYYFCPGNHDITTDGMVTAWKTRTHREPCYSFDHEATIPFASLSLHAPAPGERWRVNFRRKEMSRGSYADWQYPIGYEPDRFGYLLFGE
jgi:hypothetical protein